MKKTKIVFFGDSITDMLRDRNYPMGTVYTLGVGYPHVVATSLSRKDPVGYEIINQGISGNRVVDLYSRIKADVWNLKPDVLSVLIGVNDVWHELDGKNGVELDRFEKVYSMLVEDTLKVLPDVKIVLMEPFVLKGAATEAQYDQFLIVKEYAKAVKRIAEKYGTYFLPLQKKLDEYSAKYGVEPYLGDGVHPNTAGATLIGDEWVDLFFKEIEDKC